MSAGLLGPEDLATIFGVSRRRIVEWQHLHSWPCVRIGRTLRWTPEQVEQIKARHSVTAQGVKPADGRTAKSARRAK